jgi:2-polyprenyl-3-methyl-5-hydroxy-6-metoxy-1,4-benzoquinol methylase
MKEADIRPQELFNRYLELCDRDAERFFADRSAFVEIACPACGSDNQELGLEKLAFKYNVCMNCGSLFASPRPSRGMMETYYRESEAAKFWVTDFFKVTEDARRKALFEPRARLISETVARYGVPDPGTLVDIGSGYGIFLEEMAKLKVFDSIVAIEPSPHLASVCRDKQFPVVEKPVEALDFGEVQASWVTAFEVLEHVFDPREFMAAVRRIVAPGGFCLFSTLTVTGFDIQVLWEHSKSVQPPMHLNFLSLGGLELAARNAGFEVIELSTPGRLDVDIVYNTVTENPRIELPKFVRQLVFRTPQETRDAFQQFLQAHRLSSHVQCILRAPSR